MGHFHTVPAPLGLKSAGSAGTDGYELVNKTPGEIRILQEQLLSGARRKGELLKWLMRTVEWDFFLGVFGECHRGGHILWPEPIGSAGELPENALLDVYREVDTSLGSLLDGVDRKHPCHGFFLQECRLFTGPRSARHGSGQ
jgi:hypothetical protein